MHKTSRIFYYTILPLDFGWRTLPTAEEYRALLLKDFSHESSQGAAAIQDFNMFFDACFEGTTGAVPWEGDFREEPRVIVLPGEVEPLLAIIWKQDNNGTTFVASQVRMPWLDQIST